MPYVAHVSYGQARILIGRESIEDRLEDPDVGASEKARLRLVTEVKRFAHEELDLAGETSYASVFDTKGAPIAWNVSACADDAFIPYTWWFPIVGTMPYKGWFDREPALEEARELRAGHRDVVVYPVPAYSTLGWFADPIFTPMLEDAEDELANTILHELAHATVFVDADADFNETLATFVGNQGTVEFFSRQGGPRDPRLLHSIAVKRDDLVFSEAIKALRARLEAIYASDASREEKLAAKAREVGRFQEEFASNVRPKLETDRYDAFGRRALNNAEILGLQRYHGDLATFAALHEKLGSDLRRTIEKLKEIADSDRPAEALRAATR